HRSDREELLDVTPLGAPAAVPCRVRATMPFRAWAPRRSLLVAKRAGLEARERTVLDRVPDVGHQARHEPQVVDGGQLLSQPFAGSEQVPHVRAGVVLAGVAVATGLERFHVVRVTSVA